MTWRYYDNNKPLAWAGESGAIDHDGFVTLARPLHKRWVCKKGDTTPLNAGIINDCRLVGVEPPFAEWPAEDFGSEADFLLSLPPVTINSDGTLSVDERLYYRARLPKGVVATAKVCVTSGGREARDEVEIRELFPDIPGDVVALILSNMDRIRAGRRARLAAEQEKEREAALSRLRAVGIIGS